MDSDDIKTITALLSIASMSTGVCLIAGLGMGLITLGFGLLVIHIGVEDKETKA
jgi:hypothetical protein